MPSTYWDRRAQQYAQMGEWDFWRKPRQRIVDGVQGRVLEVCCGGGRLVVDLLRAGCDACGSDLSPAMAAIAQAALRDAGFAPARIQVADVCRLPYRDRAFDYVVCTGALGLFDLARKRAALAEMTRICRGQLRLLEAYEKRSGLYLGRVLGWMFDGQKPIPPALFDELGWAHDVPWSVLGGAFAYIRGWRA